MSSSSENSDEDDSMRPSSFIRYWEEIRPSSTDEDSEPEVLPWRRNRHRTVPSSNEYQQNGNNEESNENAQAGNTVRKPSFWDWIGSKDFWMCVGFRDCMDFIMFLAFLCIVSLCSLLLYNLYLYFYISDKCKILLTIYIPFLGNFVFISCFF